MPNKLRRFEILLPLRFNDGQPVPDRLIGETIRELKRRFGAVSSETQVIQGTWVHEDETHRDSLVRIWVDAPDEAASRDYFLGLKENLKERFQQIEIWVTTYPIEAL